MVMCDPMTPSSHSTQLCFYKIEHDDRGEVGGSFKDVRPISALGHVSLINFSQSA